MFIWTPRARDAFDRELERRIPAQQRQWDAGAGAWRVHVAFTDFALALAEKHFPDAWPIENSAEDVAELGEAFAELHLLPTAPTEVVDAACRALLAIYRAHDTASPHVVRVTAACATILRHYARRDSEALHKLASTPWPDDE
jgi:hypothetical protein